MTTAVIPEAYAPLLHTEAVMLWPWVRGHWPRDTPYYLWQFFEAEGAGPQVFWASRAASATVGDLIEFTRFLEPGDGSREVLMVQAVGAEPGQTFAGLIWFEDLLPGDRASVGLWYRRRYWGRVANEASACGRRYVFARYDLRSVWAYTPWRAAVKHGARAGFQVVAQLPEFAKYGDAYRDVYVLRLTRAQHEAQERAGTNGHVQ